MSNLKVNDKIFIQFFTSPGCVECEKAKNILNRLKSQFDNLEIERIDIMSFKGMNLAIKYSIMASPAIIVNNELFSVGSLDEKNLLNIITKCEKKY